jgi:filamentous hemagglutinin
VWLGDTIAYNEAMQRQAAWAIGGQNEVMLHTVIGGIMADLGGGNFASGAAGSGMGEIIEGRLKNLSPDIQKFGSAVIGAAAAQVVGGNAQTGASTAVSGTVNNGLSHEQQEQLVNDLTYAIDNDSKTEIITAMLKWTGVDNWNYLTEEAGWGEGADDQAQTIDFMNAAAQKLGTSFSYNPEDSLHNNINAFWGSVVESAPSIDNSTLIAAGVAGTAMVVAGVTLITTTETG